MFHSEEPDIYAALETFYDWNQKESLILMQQL